MSLTTKILTAAMASSQHVHVAYSPHVKGLCVYAYPPGTDYQPQAVRPSKLMDETVYLDWEGADEKLADVLAQIEGLGGNARHLHSEVVELEVMV